MVPVVALKVINVHQASAVVNTDTAVRAHPIAARVASLPLAPVTRVV
jgi:hypothetical protein